MVRSDIVDCFAKFGAVLGMLENFGPTSVSRSCESNVRAADAELILESATRRLTVEVGIFRRRALPKTFRSKPWRRSSAN